MKHYLITIFFSGVLVCLTAAGGAASERGDAAIVFSSNLKGELEACG